MDSNYHELPASYNFKIVLLGEGHVGKTSILLRYAEDKFNTNHRSTIQASFLNKKVILNGKKVNLVIWDTAGQERFHSLGPIYYRDSHGAIIVYDITDERSYQRVCIYKIAVKHYSYQMKNWVRELQIILGNDVTLCIAGNKMDLEKERIISVADAIKYSESVHSKYYETSAKTGYGIQDLFTGLISQLLEKYESKCTKETNNASHTIYNQSKRLCIVPNEENQIKLRNNCC